MKLVDLKVSRYRSLREETISIEDLNVFIGPNASGKSTILDALRFLHEGVQFRNFREPVDQRGGILNLGWKGDEIGDIELIVRFEAGESKYEWTVRLTRHKFKFSVHEVVVQSHAAGSPNVVLEAQGGKGWWLSGTHRVELAMLFDTDCAVCSASTDAAFPARPIVEFVRDWGFFDPNPFSLQRGRRGVKARRLDAYGRNLAERLFVLRHSDESAFSQIVSAAQSVLGLPTKLEPRETEGTYYFVQEEPGLRDAVYQTNVSSGTLRILALMTALFEAAGNRLVAIEEPENYVHPTALAGLADHLLNVRDRVQVLITTHSPLLLDFLNEPGAVCTVRRTAQEGTKVSRESNPNGIRRALEASGFGLGEFYETKGFGG
ncbi:MAG: AAA family ATPase [Thermoguttaceae bacterium]|jgi:predicted ATPase|nr:AAA family ATPase [Thermoguttaceae bacterium]